MACGASTTARWHPRTFTGAPGVHPQRRWYRTSLGHSQCPRPIGSTSHSSNPDSDIRSGILGIEFRLSTKALCSWSHHASSRAYWQRLSPLRGYGPFEVFRSIMLMPLSTSHFLFECRENGSKLVERLFSIRNQVALEFRVLAQFYRADLDSIMNPSSRHTKLFC